MFVHVVKLKGPAMKQQSHSARLVALLAAGVLSAIVLRPVHAGPGHEGGHHEDARHMLDEMRELHSGHEHGHDFEAIEAMEPEEMERVMAAMQDIGLAIPSLDPVHGRELFVGKGCIVCHSVNGIGGEVGPPIDAANMAHTMNAFEFAARMWRGADAMIAMQKELFGDQIELSGQDLADLVAFAHDADEQAKLHKEDIPERFRTLMQ